MPSYLTGIIDRVESDFIVLKLNGDQELFWPKNTIDFNYTAGDMVNLNLTRDEVKTIHEEDNAKNILRQIFQPNA